MTVKVTTSSGTPVPDVSISLNGGFDGRSARTDAAGRARFPGIPGGEASATTYASGFHGAQKRFLATPEVNTDVTLIIEQVTEATPVVLAVQAVPATDGLSVTVDVDVAVLGEDGRVIETLTAADFGVSGSDCGFMWCVAGPDGRSLLDGGYGAKLDSDGFGWREASTRPRPPMTAALLLEQSEEMADFDPKGVRLGAVNAFLESILPPDLVSLATYRGVPEAPVLTTYGPFTSDGAQYRAAVDALTGLEAGTNPLHGAVSDMLSFIATRAPRGPNDPPPSLVVLTSSWSWQERQCQTCAHEERLSVAATSRRLGIPIIAIGRNEPEVDIAARTGGAAVIVQDPAQYPIAFGSLDSIIGRVVGFNRVRVVLNAGGVYGRRIDPVFVTGHTVWTYLWVRIGPDTTVQLPLTIPIQ